MVKRVAIILCIIGMLAFPVWGQEITPILAIPLPKGQQAPVDGLLFAKESLIALAKSLQELNEGRQKIQLLEGQVQALRDQSEAQDRVIKELEEARAKTAIALAKAEFIMANQDWIFDRLKEAVSIYREALEQERKTSDGLRSELFWNRILGFIPVVGLVAAIVGGF